MYALFEDSGKYLAGRVMNEAEASAQIELDSGKRLKVKAAHIVLKFDKPAPAALLAAAGQSAAQIDLDLAWECAPEDEFGFADLATDYFGGQPSTEQQAAALLALFEAPHYFRRAGKGRFKKASADVLKQALAAIEKRKQIAAQIAQWAGDLAAGQCPPSIKEQLYKILFKPDKNAPEYKAVVEAANATQRAPLDLLKSAGAIASPYQFHAQRFLLEFFPKGTQFPSLQAPAITEELPQADVQAFSIDDSSTTEIDDALSVQGLGTGSVTLGIHIAAPGLALKNGDPLDALARTRYSTVYMPGHKITMLPDAVVQHYTLQEGRHCPALSLYVQFDEATLQIQNSHTRIERVWIDKNLRHDQLDSIVTQEWLEGENSSQNSDSPAYSVRGQLSFLYRLALHLKAQREVVRGKPETFNRPDYNFKLQGVEHEPRGDETVEISTRQRGSPLDLMVAEAMILANSTWGAWLHELGVPAIYRSQASLAPGIKVRMGLKALPHAGIGVKCYAWSTSPLRRYTDLVNQWQIIACARHGQTAALAAPFKPKDAELFSIISGFDSAYTAYNQFQNGMERYWTLKYLGQQGLSDITGTLIKDNLVRADTLPLVLPVLGAQGLPRGAHLRVKLGAVDLLTLDVSGTLLERIDASADAVTDETTEDDGEEVSSGPIALALDVRDADAVESVAAGDNPKP
jgi:exoribonuclease II